MSNSFGSTSVGPDGSTTFTVRLDAVVSGTFSGALQFANTGVDENPFNFAVSSVAAEKQQVYLPLMLK